MSADDDYFDDEMMGLYGDPTGEESDDELDDEEEGQEDYDFYDEDQEDDTSDDTAPNIRSPLRRQGKGYFSNASSNYSPWGVDHETGGDDQGKPRVGHCRICGAEVVIDELPDSISRDAFKSFGLCLNCQWGFFMENGGHF